MSRLAFEKWVNEVGPQDVEAAWEAWKGALAELAKQVEPVGFLVPISKTALPHYVPLERTCRNADDLYGWRPLYAYPLPQADLVAEIERLKKQWEKESVEADNWSDKCEELAKQLSAAQVDNEDLLKVLKTAYAVTSDHDDNLPFDWAVYCEMLYQAIVAHKTRQPAEGPF